MFATNVRCCCQQTESSPSGYRCKRLHTWARLTLEHAVLFLHQTCPDIPVFISSQLKARDQMHHTSPLSEWDFWHFSHTHLSINNDVKQWFVFFTHHMSHIPSQARDSLTRSLINKNISFYKIFISNKIVDCDKWRKLSQNLFKLTEIIFTVNIVYWYLLC